MCRLPPCLLPACPWSADQDAWSAACGCRNSAKPFWYNAESDLKYLQSCLAFSLATSSSPPVQKPHTVRATDYLDAPGACARPPTQTTPRAQRARRAACVTILRLGSGGAAVGRDRHGNLVGGARAVAHCASKNRPSRTYLLPGSRRDRCAVICPVIWIHGTIPLVRYDLRHGGANSLTNQILLW